MTTTRNSSHQHDSFEGSLDHIECVLIDRDGVVNFDSEDYIKHPDEWHPIPGALEAIARMQAVMDVAICTNQSGVGRGLYDLNTLEAIHSKMCRALQAVGGRSINILFCPHKPDAGCTCRKPKPGLLIDALNALNKDPRQTLFVGDSAKDLDAADAAGCLPVLVLTGNGTKTLSSRDEHPVTFDNLAHLADTILARR